MSQLAAASWGEARRRYTEVTGLDPDDSQFPHPSSIDELLRTLEIQSQNFADFRSRKGKFFHVLFEISKPISIIANVAGGEAEGAFPAAKVCLGTLSHLITTARGVSSAYDSILDLLGQLKVRELCNIKFVDLFLVANLRIQTFLIRLNAFESTEIPASLKSHFLDMHFLLMKIFAYSTKAVMKGTRERFSRFAKNLLLGDDGVISGYVAKLDKLTKSEDLLQGALTLANTQKIIDGQDRMDQHMEKLFALSTPAQVQFRAEKNSLTRLRVSSSLP